MPNHFEATSVPLSRKINNIASGYHAFAFTYALFFLSFLLVPSLLSGVPLAEGLAITMRDSYGRLLGLIGIIVLHAGLAAAVRRISWLRSFAQIVVKSVVSALAIMAALIAGWALWRYFQGSLDLPRAIFAASFAFCYCWLALGVAKIESNPK